MKKIFYLTTPLYYVNDRPHLGHAYTTIAADSLARWYRMNGEKVFFLTGSDEHGEKIAQAAAAQGKKPQEWVDYLVKEFQSLWEMLNISYDYFIRTTQPEHEDVVREVFQKLLQKGDIYKGKYVGWYCVPCETYWTETQVISSSSGNSGSPRCPDCQREVGKISEESYFFKLSKYEKTLLRYYEEHPEFLQPKFRRSEIINFVKEGLRDISVSRTQVKWGISVPGEENHTIYVWFDALLNYITAAGYKPDTNCSSFEEIWPADLHLVGKEIFRFHTVIWPAMLLALDLPLPKTVFAHGWWTAEGEKMSKSKGNVVQPERIISEYNLDAFRYFVLREIPFGNDGDFSTAAFQQRYNSDLANDFGNLVSRILTMVEKYFSGLIPHPEGEERNLEKLFSSNLKEKVTTHFLKLEFQQILVLLWEIIGQLNYYVNEKAPWDLAKTKGSERKNMFYCLLESLRLLAVYLYPFLPQTSEKIFQLLSVEPEKKYNFTWGGLSSGKKIGRVMPLFPRK